MGFVFAIVAWLATILAMHASPTEPAHMNLMVVFVSIPYAMAVLFLLVVARHIAVPWRLSSVWQLAVFGAIFLVLLLLAIAGFYAWGQGGPNFHAAFNGMVPFFGGAVVAAWVGYASGLLLRADFQRR